MKNVYNSLIFVREVVLAGRYYSLTFDLKYILCSRCKCEGFYIILPFENVQFKYPTPNTQNQQTHGPLRSSVNFEPPQVERSSYAMFAYSSVSILRNCFHARTNAGLLKIMNSRQVLPNAIVSFFRSRCSET